MNLLHYSLQRTLWIGMMSACLCCPLSAEEEEAAAAGQEEEFVPPETAKAQNNDTQPAPTQQIPQSNEGWLVLDNGDSIPASFLGKKEDSGNILEIRSSLMDGGFGFDIGQIDSLYLVPGKKDFPGNAHILLTNGDLIKGTLRNLDDKNISVETTWGGVISLKRNMISSISFSEKDQIIYSSLDTTNRLLNMAGNEAWSIRENNIVSNNRGAIGTKIPLENKIRLSFVFSCDRYSQLGIGLWANNLDTDFPPYVYMFRLTPGTAQLQRRVNGGTTSRPNNALSFPPFDKILLPTRIDIFADRDTETFYLYVNGILQANWNKNEAKEEVMDDDQPPLENTSREKDDFGNGLYFTNHIAGSFVSISNITVTKWNGIAPGNELLDIPGSVRSKSIVNSDKTPESATVIQPRKFETQKPQPGYALIHLKNGDFFRTKISGVAPKQLTAESKEQSLNIPLERIWGLEFTPEKEIKQRLSKDDIQIYFSDNSRITLRLRQGSEQNLRAFSETLGNVTIQMPYVKTVIFNLYNEALKKKRTTMDTIHDEASFRK